MRVGVPIWVGEDIIFMARQQGLDQSHMVVWGKRWLETSTVMPPEWDRARVAFLRMSSGGSLVYGPPVQWQHESQ